MFNECKILLIQCSVIKGVIKEAAKVSSLEKGTDGEALDCCIGGEAGCLTEMNDLLVFFGGLSCPVTVGGDYPS